MSMSIINCIYRWSWLDGIGTLRYPGRGGRENVGLLEKAWSEDAANLVGKTN